MLAAGAMPIAAMLADPSQQLHVDSITVLRTSGSASRLSVCSYVSVLCMGNRPVHSVSFS